MPLLGSLLPLLQALECNCSCFVHDQQPWVRGFCTQLTRELLFLSSDSKVRVFLICWDVHKSRFDWQRVHKRSLSDSRVRPRHPFFNNSNLKTPKRRNSASPLTRIWKHSLPLSVVCTSHFFSLCPFFFFFTFTRFNKAEHGAYGHGEDGQLCRWSRWKSTPGHVKSEIVLKLERKPRCLWKERKRERTESRSTESLEWGVREACRTPDWLL